jgi:8-oxo-dGTP pyrophosphatase MutT (NUDIX family)
LITLKTVRAALALDDPAFDPVAAQQKISRGPRSDVVEWQHEDDPRLAATLMLLYPREDGLNFLLTRRPDTLNSHAGQISFPGGKQEVGETFVETALRETCEEVGICERIEVLGHLTPLWIPPSNFEVHPIVGMMKRLPLLQINPMEVAEVIETPLEILLDESVKGSDTMTYKDRSFEYGFYRVGGHQVWGATAAMLSEFESRLRFVLD